MHIYFQHQKYQNEETYIKVYRDFKGTLWRNLILILLFLVSKCYSWLFPLLYYVQILNTDANLFELDVETWSKQVRVGFDKVDRLAIADFEFGLDQKLPISRGDRQETASSCWDSI